MGDKNYIRDIAKQIQGKVDQTRLPSKGVDELFDTYAVLALAKGQDVTNEDVHNAWSAWAVKFDPHSESLVPFADLPPHVQADDVRFTEAIREVSEVITGEKNS